MGKRIADVCAMGRDDCVEMGCRYWSYPLRVCVCESTSPDMVAERVKRSTLESTSRAWLTSRGTGYASSERE